MKTHNLFAVLLLAACEGIPVPPEPVPQAAEQAFSFRIETASECTRSCFSEYETSVIRDAVVAVYAATGDLVHSGSPEEPVVLNRNHPYSYYVLTGDLAETAVPVRESELRGSVHRYTMDGAGGFIRYHEDWKAVPMAGRVEHTAPAALAPEGGVIPLPATRLFARMDLRILTDESLRQNYTVDIRSVKVRNIALSVAPFEDRLADRGLVAPYEADITRAADAGGYWTLYLPENLQGDLLPGNTDPSGKTADALSAAGYNPDLCTYIEAEVGYDSGFGVGGTARYRFYPGRDNTGNFDIRRNTPYAVTLTLTAAGLDITGNWKIDTSDIDDHRILTLVPLSPSVALDGMVLLKPTYSEDGTDMTAARLGTRPGYAAGYEDDIDRYLGGGSPGSPVSYSGIDVMCGDCDYILPGYPENGSRALRLAWFRNLLQDDGSGYYLCPDCGNYLGDEDTAEIYNNDPLPPGEEHRGTCLAFPLPGEATAGTVLTFRAATHDGKKRAEATVSVFRTGRLTLDTHLVPKYLAQRGVVTVIGRPQGVERVCFRIISGANVISISASGLSCDILATALGSASVAVLDAATNEELERFSVTVTAPLLTISNPSLHLHPNGDAETVICQYTTSAGNVLLRGQDFDETLYDRLLKPVFSVTGAYLACLATTGDVWISDINGIPTGFSSPIGQVYARAINCPSAGSPWINAYCINPFGGMSNQNTCLGRIEDYTLLPDAEEQAERFPVQGHINAGSYRVTAEPLSPASADCRSMQFSLSEGNTHILTVISGIEGDHAHGKIAVSVSVENARSHQELSQRIGYVEVFLHGAIGGKALLHPDPDRTGEGWVSASIATCPEWGDGPFDDLYDQLAGHRFIHDGFDESNLYPVSETTYYQSDDNDWYGRNHQASRPEDRVYLTRYERTILSTEGIAHPSGEIYRIFPGLIDTYYDHFASVDRFQASGNDNFIPIIDPSEVSGIIAAGVDRNGDRQYGMDSETDDNGVPYRLLSVIRGWIAFDTV